MKITLVEHIDPEIWEPPFLLEIFRHLQDEISDDYHFIISRANSHSEISDLVRHLDDNKDKKNILFLLSDELGLQNNPYGPYFMRDKIHLIFRTYNNKSLYDEDWVFPIPCGFSCGVGHHSQDGKTCLVRNFEYLDKPLKERKYDLFFSGQIDNHRRECVEQINKISGKYNSLINTTSSFGKGFSLKEYYELMSDSKIAIVPQGVVIPESFRFFEAAKSGCVIISSYPINDDRFNNWYYQNSGAIFIKNWSEMTEDLIDNILDNLDKHQELNKSYFESKISTKALSDYIKKIIKNKN